MDDDGVLLERDGLWWRLRCDSDPALVMQANAYFGYLADRNYSPQTVRSYGYGLLAFHRWLRRAGLSVDGVVTDDVLGFLSACRQERIPGRPGPNVVDLAGRPVDRLAPASVNLRLAAVAGMYEFVVMRDPTLSSPIPKGKPSSWFAAGERSGMLAHIRRRPASRSRLRLRTPRRLARALDVKETATLLGSLRSSRDLAMAGLMLYCGLRSCEVLALGVLDVDIGGRWLSVHGKGGKDRRVPLDEDLAAVIASYLLKDRPESSSEMLFLSAKGPTRGQPLTAAGLRSIFRYHRSLTGITAGSPHVLRHTFGTALAEAGVDLAVMQSLLGHAHVDTTARYIHLSPTHVKAQYNAARDRQRLNDF